MLDKFKNIIEFIKEFRILTFSIVLLLNFVYFICRPFKNIFDNLLIQYNVNSYINIINGIAIFCFVIFEVFVIVFWLFLFINKGIDFLEKKYKILQDIFSVDSLNSSKVYHGSKVQALVAFQWLASVLLLLNLINHDKLVEFVIVTFPNSSLLIILVCISFFHILEGIFFSLSSIINKYFNVYNFH